MFRFPHAWWRTYSRTIMEWLSIALLFATITVPPGVLAWFVFFTNTFNVQSITVVDAREHTQDTVRGLLQPAHGRNIFFVQTAVLQQRLLTEIPQVRDVHILRKLPGTLKVVIQEKTPVLLLVGGSTYHFIDREGIAYEEAHLTTLPGIVLPTIKNNDSGALVTVGAPAVTVAFVEFVEQASNQLPESTGAQVAEIRIPSLAAREVHFLLDNNWIIRFDITRPMESQLDVLRRLLEHTIPEEEQAFIEYIDLRIQNRVYYKTSS